MVCQRLHGTCQPVLSRRVNEIQCLFVVGVVVHINLPLKVSLIFVHSFLVDGSTVNTGPNTSSTIVTDFGSLVKMTVGCT